MRISVQVKTGARENKVKKLAEARFIVFVKARPEKGKANQAVAEVLAKHFGVSKTRVRLVLGRRLKQKVFEVL